MRFNKVSGLQVCCERDSIFRFILAFYFIDIFVSFFTTGLLYLMFNVFISTIYEFYLFQIYLIFFMFIFLYKVLNIVKICSKIKKKLVQIVENYLC